MAADFNFGEFVVPLYFSADDIREDVSPQVKRYLLILQKLQEKETTDIQHGLFGQLIQEFIFGKIWKLSGQVIYL